MNSMIYEQIVLGVVQVGSYIALFSPPNALGLFYLCNVLGFGVAVEDTF